MNKRTLVRLGISGILTLFLVMSFNSNASAEKMKITGKNKTVRVISQSTADPGDKDGHLLMQTVSLSNTTSSDENWNDVKMIDAQQTDQMGAAGSHTGYGYHLHKNGDRTFFKYWGTQKAAGEGMLSLEGKFEWTGGTGKLQNVKGGGTYTCKGSMKGNECDWQGEVEY